MAQLIPTSQISLLIILWMTVTSVQAQLLRGTITDEGGEPLAGATVIVKNTTRGTATDLNGQYSLNQLPVGQHTLVISYLGYQTQQQTITLSSQEVKEVSVQLTETSGALADEVIVTATRTARAIDEVPVPAQVITGEQIERIGALRLNEVLQEQTGLQMISDHGAGLQMQGLDSDYILILIDGEPVIGRTAGTVDLTRLTVNNIERIEIIRGPSSSLYGSEAMAGVVNIITSGNEPGWNGSLGSQFRSFGTWDTQAEAGYRNDRLSVRMFANRLRSDGYDLNEETVSQTVSPYEALTFGPKVSYRINDRLNLRISSRFYQESNEDEGDVDVAPGSDIMLERIDSKNVLTDWNVLPILEYQPSDRHKMQIRHYITGYATETDETYQRDGQTFNYTTFDQFFQRSEAQYDWYVSDQHIITGGGGHLTERVEATRYDDVNRFYSTYGFAQYQWQPTARWNVVAGGRYDIHSDYADRFSPKLAVGYEALDWLSLQASFGGGYKAPDFRQLLLNFTNARVGYSVLGSRIVEEEFAEFEQRGEIKQVLIDPATVEEIQAESSLAYNLGVRLKRSDQLRWQVNLFRNDIRNLIDTAPIAIKTNDQNIVSYFNFDEVLTQGVETQVDYEPYPSWAFSISYQYLDTRDKEAYRRVENGEVFRRNADNRTVQVTTADYGGLINRSRHSGNAKLFYTNSRHNFDISLRGIYRGRWGVGDFDGSGVLDADSEYADGYWLVNLAARKHFGDWLTLEAGANNLTDQTNPFEPALAGRTFFAGLQVNFVKPNL
ncbi:TonB-dependent receptor [Tunicatimonas pelagia]|uniref:TonB-dependent receptor n=1 Tax=Tunicatimonas pelagia TaxID=931531 RepID=UPI00266529A0|nr:TonB-dependent receptor [Tunicatimonas pelagia]WKN43025.1 TonB-dependent receptor [Tunicatimonas pelagia]